MKKLNRRPSKPRTHFEQIPFSRIVNKVIQEKGPMTPAPVLDDVIRKPAARRTEALL